MVISIIDTCLPFIFSTINFCVHSIFIIKTGSSLCRYYANIHWTSLSICWSVWWFYYSLQSSDITLAFSRSSQISIGKFIAATLPVAATRICTGLPLIKGPACGNLSRDVDVITVRMRKKWMDRWMNLNVNGGCDDRRPRSYLACDASLSLLLVAHSPPAWQYYKNAWE
jgi:hypothetical protein